MNRAVVVAVLVVASCARGGAAQDDASTVNNNGRIDASGDGSSRRPDAAVFRDAPELPDAKVYLDATVTTDAHVYMDACVPVTTELLANPAFDLTPVGTGWTQVPIDTAYPDITSDGALVAQSAPDKAWLGGIASTGPSLTDLVYQDVAVPAGTTKLALTGYYGVGTTELSTTVVDTGSLALIQTDGTPIETVLSVSNLTNVAPWKSFTHTFAANVAGQTVRLRMTSTNRGDGSGLDYTNFFFDTLALKATYCP
jgi:hypothetical protein